MTYHLEARMANTVRIPRPHSPPDSEKSIVSTEAPKETFGQQISRRRREERDRMDSRNPPSAGPFVKETASLEEDLHDGSSDERMDDAHLEVESSEDEEETEFWRSKRGNNGEMEHEMMQTSMGRDRGL